MIGSGPNVATTGLTTALVTALTVALLFGSVGCGDDPITRNQFVAQLSAVTSGVDKATPELAGCIFDRIAGDAKLLESASKTIDIAKQDEDRLAAITKRCRIDLSTTTTSAPKRPTTTLR